MPGKRSANFKKPLELVIDEGPKLGKREQFRVRLIQPNTDVIGHPAARAIDIREWVDNPGEDGEAGYVGFTRKGVRLRGDDCLTLTEIIREWFAQGKIARGTGV